MWMPSMRACLTPDLAACGGGGASTDFGVVGASGDFGGGSGTTDAQQAPATPNSTAPGTGTYYNNDTPINIPAESSEAYRPFGSSSWWDKLLNFDHAQALIETMAAGSAALRYG